jgi:hypothetical protein
LSIGQQAGKLIFDSFERQLYFLVFLAKTDIKPNQDPEIVTKDSLDFEESGFSLNYPDFSGLIDISTNNSNRLLRIYRRDVIDDECEYVFGFINGSDNFVTYYSGLEININQLF